MRTAFAFLVVIAAIFAASGGHGARDKGRAAVEGAQCNRCHAVPGIVAAPRESNCVACHLWIMQTSRDEAATEDARDTFPLWDRHVERVKVGHFTAGLPSLASLGQRFRKEWLRAFLTHPYDVRPNLSESMIRPALDAATLDAVLEYLTRDAATLKAGPVPPADPQLVGKGAQLFEQKGCATCHLFGSRVFPSSGPQQFDLQPFGARALAPDLRHTRDRFRPEALVAWIKNPSALKVDAAMPAMGVTDDEALALAAFILHDTHDGSPRTAIPTSSFAGTAPARVTWKEVDERVFSRVCIHCHMDPALNGGDGGPGNTGGFGHRAIRLSFSSYGEVLRGSVDERGRKRSIFRKGASGQSVLMERLARRHVENRRDRVVPGIDPLVNGPENVFDGLSGMPMGLPALSADDMALVDAWVAAGHPGPDDPADALSAYYRTNP